MLWKKDTQKYKIGQLDHQMQSQLLTSLPIEVRESIYYICGPLPMRKASLQVLDQYQVPRSQIFEESFVIGETSPPLLSEQTYEVCLHYQGLVHKDLCSTR